MSDTLVAFLLARIAEDEQRAKDARGYQTGSRYEGQPLNWQLHMERWSPACVLAEVEAKRRIVELVNGYLHSHISDDFSGERLGEDVLDLLALPYAGHPDFRPEWAPEA